MPPREFVNSGPSWPQHYTFSPAVRKGNLLFISGLTGVDAQGNIVEKGDIVAQTRRIFQKIKAILEAAGGTLDDVVQTTDYITTTDNYRGTADVRRECFRHPFPAATGVVVKELLRQDALIEIDAVAVLDGAK